MTFTKDALQGQHIVISGGAGALGLAIVKKLTDHGALMTVNDILEADEALSRLRDYGIDMERIVYIQADLTQKPEVERFVQGATERFGDIHTALCHAGIVTTGKLIDVDVADWDTVMAINLRAAMLLAQISARQMLDHGVKGQLIFTSSWVSETPWPEIGPYHTSKAGMSQLMRGFARELAADGIRANAIAPGIVGAGMAKRQWDTDPSYRARAQRAIPLGYLQPVETVADAFLFLCSPAASYMTGSVLFVDGGCSLYPMD
ncbi:MAG TPA: SDR family oxidoreductase [Phototrophicaceae bacterium]|nr:SDR family oxidoreductase [Phototrophicaceae bacterium]